MIGVNFQPGANSQNDQNGNGQSRSSGIQEAIKILSLRLPKVVGAQAGAPQALLTSQGGGGSRVDSVVNQIMSRILPTGQPQQPPQANLESMPQQGGPSGPSFSGNAQPQYQPPRPTQWTPPPNFTPRVVMPSAFPQGDFTMGPDGRPVGSVPGAIAPLPTPDPWANLQKLLGSQTYPSGSDSGDQFRI